MPQVYIRFITATFDETSNRRQGIFHAAYDLIDAKELHDFEVNELRTLLKWFEGNLKIPKRFSQSSKSRAVGKAISWYKNTAQDHISGMHSICQFLDRHKIHTEMLRTDRPGYIVYEDDRQIAAVPFADTVT